VFYRHLGASGRDPLSGLRQPRDARAVLKGLAEPGVTGGQPLDARRGQPKWVPSPRLERLRRAPRADDPVAGGRPAPACRAGAAGRAAVTSPTMSGQRRRNVVLLIPCCWASASSLAGRDTEATAHWAAAVAGHLPHVQLIRCRALLGDVSAKARRQLTAAGRTDALETVNEALSGA